MSLKDVPVRARLWAPDRSLPRFLGDFFFFFVRFNLTSFAQYASGGGNARRCRSSVPCCTLGQRRCTKVLPKGAVLHPRAMKMYESVAQESRAAPSGDEDVRRCRSSAPRCTLGRRRCTEVSLKRAVLHPRATIKHESVAQESRAALLGNDKCGFRCRSGFLHPYFILPCALGQREGAEESPDCAARHLRVRDSQASSFPESPAPSPAPVVGGVQVAGRMVVRPLYRPLYPAYSFDIWKFLLFLS